MRKKRALLLATFIVSGAVVIAAVIWVYINATPAAAAPEPEPQIEYIIIKTEQEVVTVTETVYVERPATAPISDSVPLDWNLQQSLLMDCALFGVPLPLALAVMEQESDFNPDADNGVCIGLMQIHRGNNGWHIITDAGVADLTDPAQNIRAGVAILRAGLTLYDDVLEALTWYNTGKCEAVNAYAYAVQEKAARWEELLCCSST